MHLFIGQKQLTLVGGAQTGNRNTWVFFLAVTEVVCG